MNLRPFNWGRWFEQFKLIIRTSLRHIKQSFSSVSDSRWKNGLAFLCGITITLLFLFVISFYTPFKYYMAQYYNVEMRKDMVLFRMQADSLLQVNAQQNAYLQNWRKYIHSSQLRDSAADSINLSVAHSLRNQAVPFFYAPVKGIVKDAFDSSQGKVGTTVLCAYNTPILSLLSGIVVSVNYNIDGKWDVVLQHKDGYLTIYKSLGISLCKTGDFLEGGSVIGQQIRPSKKEREPIVEIQLWKDGAPLDIQEFISF